MPKAMQTKVKVDLHNIWMAESRLEAEKALSLFLRKYQAKYPKAADRLTRDKDELLAIYDFPAEHWTLDSHLKCNSKVFEESLGGRSIAEAFSGC